MEFCPKCGSRLVLKKEKAGEKKSLMLVCSKCGYRKSGLGSDATRNTSKIMPPDPQKLVVVIGKKEQKLRTLPTARIECPKCGNNLAYVWQVQTRSADESSTQFFRCTKCGYTFREYS
jgi:DNA-directed RNA polymerase subunit M